MRLKYHQPQEEIMASCYSYEEPIETGLILEFYWASKILYILYFYSKLLCEVVNLMRFGNRKCVDDFLDWFDVKMVWFIKIGKIGIKIELINFIFIQIIVKNLLLFKNIKCCNNTAQFLKNNSIFQCVKTPTI